MLRLLIISVLLVSDISVFGNKHHNKKDRIIGGNDTPIEHYPYMVSLHYNEKFFCGGAIIALNRILTSGACVKGIDKKLLSIRAGSSAYKSGGDVFKIKEVHIHPKYDYVDYDVAVLELKINLKESKAVKAAQLQKSGEDLKVDSDATISGWGFTSTSPSIRPPVSEELKGATVYIVKQEDCVKAYEGKYTVNDRMICAAAPGKDSCKGDGGGPLVDLHGIIMGVISWGYDCANEKYPGVYTKISNPEINKFIVDHLM